MTISRNILYLLFSSPDIFEFALYSQINCVSVDDNGDVIVSWQASTDADFASYEIFFPIVPMDHLTHWLLTDIIIEFVHNGAMADFQKYYYLRVNAKRFC